MEITAMILFIVCDDQSAIVLTLWSIRLIPNWGYPINPAFMLPTVP